MYLFTSFTQKQDLLIALSDFKINDSETCIEFQDYGLTISDGDDYFLNQREGMLNFYSSLMNADHMEVHSKFIMQLASCVKGYRLAFQSSEEVTPVINKLVEKLHGLVFSPDMTFYTSDWKVIIDMNGGCDLEDYDVKMSTETFDANVEVDSESQARKQRTIDLLKSYNIPVLDSLPTVPSSSQVQYRSEGEVATRIIGVAATAVKGELRSSDIPFQVLEKYGIHPNDVSPVELNFLQNPTPGDQEFVNATWRYESLNVLLWAAGYIDDLHFPTQIVDVAVLTEDIRECRDFEEFLLNANMRGMDEILDQLDLTYRLHWACVNARVKNEQVPMGLNPSVIFERHYAFNWLVNRYNEAWDDVSTPT